MRVFVTGGTGYVGAHIVRELLSRGHEVSVLSRKAQTPSANLEFVHGSLDQVETIRSAMAGHDAYIHNAIWWEEAPLSELELADTRAAINIFRAAADAGVEHLIYTSSTAVHRPFKPHMNEESRIAPTDFYGATKAAAELFVSAFSHQFEMRCNAIRPGPCIGPPAVPGERVSCDRRFKAIVNSAVRGEAIHVPKHGGRQFIAIDDLAKVYTALLESDANRETYIAVSQNHTLWEEVARDAAALAGSESRVLIEDEGVSETPELFDVGKIERDFGLAFDSRAAMRSHLQYLIALE
jgi:UDP-glucose 4-epimerase